MSSFFNRIWFLEDDEVGIGPSDNASHSNPLFQHEFQCTSRWITIKSHVDGGLSITVCAPRHAFKDAILAKKRYTTRFEIEGRDWFAWNSRGKPKHEILSGGANN